MNYSSVRRFNEKGLDWYRQVMLGTMPEGQLDPESEALTERVSGSMPFTVEKVETAKALARIVRGALDGIDIRDTLGDTGMWAWLTFVFRDVAFRMSKDGTRIVGEYHRWYPSDPNDWQKGQRHLVRMPVILLETLGSDADHLLCNPPHTLPEVREQLTSRSDMLNSAFQKVARRLYYDESKQRLKKGVGGKGAGSARRLSTFKRQFDVTWELEVVSPEHVMTILPKEFEKFL